MKISEIVQTAGWKKFMAKLYGWGASVVLAGALFKIQHYPGASIMLIAGMSTEVIIFFFSAFEPIQEDPDWTLVYPELAGVEVDEEEGEESEKSSSSRETGKGGNGKSSDSEGLQKLESMMEGIDVNSNVFENIGEGLQKLHQTTANLSDISEATVATNEYANQIQNASNSASQLANSFSQASEDLNKSVDNLTSSYSNTAEMISEAGSKSAEKFNQASDQLLSSYQELAESIKNSSQNISEEGQSYSERINTVNNNLSSLNAVYELQLQETNQHLENSKEIFKGFDKMMDNLKDAANETQNYNNEVARLSKNVAELNSVYGNMLSSLSFISNK